MPWASGEKAMQPTPVSPVLGERLEVRVVQLYKIHCTAKPTVAPRFAVEPRHSRRGICRHDPGNLACRRHQTAGRTTQ